MDNDLAIQLLMSINSDRLVLICGAGLSMAAPSHVPSAARLAQACSDKYEAKGFALPAGIRDDLEKLADHFFTRGMLVDLIRLVEWYPFRHSPNAGHEAIADFLACRALEFGVTTNYDFLTETVATDLGEPNFQNAIHADELIERRDHSFYLKIHGCCEKDDLRTVWCLPQVTSDAMIKARVESLRDWLSVNLKGKDILLVGFWSDWGYLNLLLEGIVNPIQANRVVLVDLDTGANLAKKAPGLWNWANTAAVRFDHVRESGADFLNELRRRFGLTFLSELFNQSIPTYQGIVGPAIPVAFPNVSSLSARELFDLRRDSEGVPNSAVPRKKHPEPTMGIVGAYHLAFAQLGGDVDGPRYVLMGKRFRIVQGAGQGLGEVKARFDSEPPEPVRTDVVICAGAFDDAGITSVVRRTTGPGGIVRSGTSGDWVTSDEARLLLGI
jgi:hypothetical protein